VPVFFFLSSLCSDREKERKKKKNCSEHHHHENQQEKNERANSILFLSFSLSFSDSSCVRAKYVHARPKGGSTRIFLLSLSLAPPILSYEHPLLLAISIRIFSSYIFPGGLERELCERAQMQASEQ